ncbi:hypothetical protein Syun_027130 [Stephania yunnanensis]|uniref:Bulb-type lectin domain-containing protein n=1 Tax=Stephania yunnanensis TaxID=152371 RepID=A0AAP0HMI4_9MAGN
MYTCSPFQSTATMVSSMIIVLLLLCTLCYATDDTITSNNLLRDGDTIVSNGGTYALGFFNPGTSQKRYIGIWFNKVSQQIWVANRHNPINNSSHGVLKIDDRGNLAIFDANSSSSVWSTSIALPISPTNNTSTLFYKLLDTGNLVLRDENLHGDFLWQSFDYPTDTFLPRMKVGWNLRTGWNWSYTSWKTPDDPSTGDFSISMNIIGLPELVIKNLRVTNYQVYEEKLEGTGHIMAGAADGSGVPGKEHSIINYSFVNNPNEIYFGYTISDDSVISRIMLDYQGLI